MLGHPMLDRVLTILNLLGVLSCVGVYSYTEYFYKRPLPNNDVEFMKLHEAAQKQTFVRPYPLTKMIINLNSKNSRLRFLEMESQLLPFLQTHIDLIEQNKALVYDAIIRVVGKMAPDEITTVSGKILLEDRIKKEINKTLDKVVVKKIYFTTFVVQ